MSGESPPPVDRATVDAMAAQISAAFWGPGGIAERLPDEERQMLRDTTIEVVDRPSAKDMALVMAPGTPPPHHEDGTACTGPGCGHLLGLFTHPPAHIKVFASEVIAMGYDPVDVATHELGHRLNYDHSLREATIAMIAHGNGVVPGASPAVVAAASASAPNAARPAAATRVEARAIIHSDSCPMCLLHSRCAEVMGLLGGLRTRAHLQHQIPLGLGGTIPLAQRKTAEARSNLALIGGDAAFVNRQAEIRTLDALLARLYDHLGGKQTPESISTAHEMSLVAWDKAYDLNHLYWLHHLHGDPATGAWQPLPRGKDHPGHLLD